MSSAGGSGCGSVPSASDLLDPSAAFVEPPQCSLWFAPKEWSRRYADTFFTACVSACAVDAQGDMQLDIGVQAGDNSWTQRRSAADFEALANQVAADAITHKQTITVPELPAKKWALTQDSAERQAALGAWLHALLGASKKICLFPSVRAFLDLDRPLARPQSDSDSDDDDQADAAPAPAPDQNNMTDQ